jgi:hypothetical protein
VGSRPLPRGTNRSLSEPSMESSSTYRHL